MDHTLYAQWTAKTLKISYNANGGSETMSNSTYTYGGSALTLPCNTFTRSGYVFDGWHVYRSSDSKWYGCTDSSVACSGSAGNTTIGWYSQSSIALYYTPKPGWDVVVVFRVALTALDTDWAASQNPSLTFNSTNMVISTEYVANKAQALAFIRTENKIDVSNYDKLYIKCSFTTNNTSLIASIGLFSEDQVPNRSEVAYTEITTTTSEKTYTIDISDLSDSYYMGFEIGHVNGGTASASLTVTQVYLGN